MTSCGSMTLVILGVFWGIIDLSQGGCLDSLEDQKWLTNTTLIRLITANNSKVIVYCTIERECNDSNKMCMFKHCFEDEYYRNEKCQEKSFGKYKVPVSHFLCLVAKILNHSLEECDNYGILCNIYSDLPPPTLPSKVKTTSAPEPQTSVTEDQTSLAPDRNTATTLQIKSTLTTVSQTDRTGITEKSIAGTESSLRSLLAASLSLNVFLPLAVYLFMCHRRKTRKTHQSNTRTDYAFWKDEQPIDFSQLSESSNLNSTTDELPD